MVVLFTVGFAAAEEEAGAGLPVFAFEAERPVLILGGEGLVLVAAFANQIGIAAVGEGVDVDPGFDHEGFAVTKSKIEVGDLGLLDQNVGVFAGEDGGLVAGGEAGVDGFLGASGIDESVAGEGARFLSVECPFDERGDEGNRRGVVLRRVFGVVLGE